MARRIFAPVLLALAAVPACNGAAVARATVTVVHSFNGETDGCTPRAGVLFDRTGTLYGTTEGCGSGGFGTAFSLSPSGTFKVLQGFRGKPDGAHPEAGLLAGSHGRLFGSTFEGGDSDLGMVFKL